MKDSFLEPLLTPTYHILNSISDGKYQELKRREIKILTYNIFMRPPAIKNNESDHKDDRLKEFIKILHEFDIICLQEMFGFLNSRKHRLINYAHKAGFHYYTESPAPSFFSSYLIDAGLLILSRFPIIYSEFKSYHYGIFSDSLCQKGVLYAKIQIKDSILHVFNTHLQASYFDLDQEAPIITRGDQLLHMRSFMDKCLKKHYKNHETILVLGDFNIDSRKPYAAKSKLRNYQPFKIHIELTQADMLNEYEAMACVLSNNYQDNIIDLLLEKYKEHPVTYAASKIDFTTNKPLPDEIILTNKEELCSNQSLDYIFELKVSQTSASAGISGLIESQKVILFLFMLYWVEKIYNRILMRMIIFNIYYHFDLYTHVVLIIIY